MTGGAFKLSDVAPRLARARDQLVERRRLERKERTLARNAVYNVERLIAHRELQLVRAQRTGNARYIGERHRKLVAAKRALPRVQARLAAAESTAW